LSIAPSYSSKYTGER